MPQGTRCTHTHPGTLMGTLKGTCWHANGQTLRNSLTSSAGTKIGMQSLLSVDYGGELQESPLEEELEQMMGKPVHMLSVDNGQADAGTLLGSRLTDQQINQLADIFADRQLLQLGFTVAPVLCKTPWCSGLEVMP